MSDGVTEDTIQKLDLEINVGNNRTNEIEEFTKELNNALKEDENLVYQGYDSRKFTNVNEERIWNKREELIREYINQNNINGADENKLYEITYKYSKGINVISYEGTYENRESLTVDSIELPENVYKGMFFRKVDGNYVFDKETTEKIYNEMTTFQKELIEEQNEKLNDMRQEGAIYKVTYLEDDCEDWRTELTNQETGETFQELEFPHDIYHQVGVDSLVKYENGTYTVIDGTNIFDLYSKDVKNYCKIKDEFITPNGKIEESNIFHKTIENVMEEFTKYAIEKLAEFIKESINKFKSK